LVLSVVMEEINTETKVILNGHRSTFYTAFLPHEAIKMCGMR